MHACTVELLQIVKDDAVKVLHSLWQQIWKTHQWSQDWKWSVFIIIPKKGNGNPLQHPSLGNPMDKGAWRATVHWVTKNQT